MVDPPELESGTRESKSRVLPITLWIYKKMVHPAGHDPTTYRVKAGYSAN